MADDEAVVRTATGESEDEAVADVVAVLKGGVIGAIAGAAGLVVMSVVLAIGIALGAFDTAAFAELASIAGGGESELLGYAVFFGGGMTTWPLLFAVLNDYLPGGRMETSGLTFGTIAWTGFILAFYTSQTGTTLALYLGLTLLAHWGYGATLGAVFYLVAARTDVVFVTEGVNVSKES
jgi:cytochrome c oxidase subunit 1